MASKVTKLLRNRKSTGSSTASSESETNSPSQGNNLVTHPSESMEPMVNLDLPTTPKIKDIVDVLKQWKTSIDNFKHSCDNKLNFIDKSIKQVNTNKADMTLTGAQIMTSVKECKDYVDNQVAIMVTRFESLESKLNALSETKQFDPEVTLIAQGVPMSDGEIPQDIASNILSDIGLPDMEIVRAKRLTPRNGKPGLFKIELHDLESKICALRHKYDIETSSRFKGVTIRSSKSHTDRLIEINTQMIIDELGFQDRFRIAANGRLLRNRPFTGSRPIGQFTPHPQGPRPGGPPMNHQQQNPGAFRGGHRGGYRGGHSGQQGPNQNRGGNHGNQGSWHFGIRRGMGPDPTSSRPTDQPQPNRRPTTAESIRGIQQATNEYLHQRMRDTFTRAGMTPPQLSNRPTVADETVTTPL